MAEHRQGWHRALVIACAAGVIAAATPLRAQPADEEAATVVEATPADGGITPVETFSIVYARPDDDLPAQADVLEATIDLALTPNGWIAHRPGLPLTRVKLAEVPFLSSRQFYDSALALVARSIVVRLQELGLIGVYAEPAPGQLRIHEGNIWDVREVGELGLTYLLTTGLVTETRSVAIGERVPEDEPAVNNRRHRKILERSPIQPADLGGDPGAVRPQDEALAAGAGETTSLLRGDAIDRYVYLLNRHPGRRVDVAVAATGEEPGAVTLDYLVTENKPWLAYAQLSNTGTESTDELRERFGFIHNQLTGGDDVLSLEYLTANFDDLHAFIASYERPLFGLPRLRGRVYGSYYEYTAGDVGLTTAQFDGEGASVGGELIWNFFQRDDAFLDATFGLRFDDIEVDNQLAAINGDESLLFGYAGVGFERVRDASRTFAGANLEFTIDGGSGDIDELGRSETEEDWVVLQLSGSHSQYLEPLFDPDLTENASLAHEVLLSARGLVSFDQRLPPNYQLTAGGLYSVRGYPQSVTAGDNVFIGSAEYRYHLPRGLAPNAEPGTLFGEPFRFVPQYAYGPVDWDFILKAFVDVARVENADRLSFERDSTLLGIGLGAEVALSRHFSARVDVGWALEDVEDGTGDNVVDSGDAEVHFVVTVVF